MQIVERKSQIAFFAALVLTAFIYLPGLQGGFVFDDFPNIVENSALHVSDLSIDSWLRALWASPSSDLQRPLASLTFAINHYFSGLDPWAMKATNLAIHLLNGLLLYALLCALICGTGSAKLTRLSRNEWLATLVAAAWLLHPINLTAVLYVVQRMESLAQLFVLAGLILYLDARQRQATHRGGARWRLWLGVPLCTLLGLSAKESAVLLPLYALMLELTVLRDVSRNRRELGIFYSVFLFIPGLIGLSWLLPGLLSENAYSTRAFTLGQRLLTEPRVLADYATWTLVPAPDFFSFYRDDYPISMSLFHPWTTIPAMLLVFTMAAAAWLLRTRRPLAALGLAWFLAAHALTSNILPLELIFEHRNYFASIGLLLAAFDLLLPNVSSRLPLVRNTIIGACLVLATFSLSLRAKVWGDPVTFAVAEAAKNPASPRATYDLGRTYVLLSGYQPDSPWVPLAIESLESAARVPNASALPESALMMLASRTGRPIEKTWWDSLINKLGRRSPTVEDANAIKSLTLCQREGHCRLNDEKVLSAYIAAVDHPRPDPSILYSYAIFAYNRLHDSKLAVNLASEAAKSHDLQYQLNFVNFLIDIGMTTEARLELVKLKSHTRPGELDFEMLAAERRLESSAERRPAELLPP